MKTNDSVTMKDVLALVQFADVEWEAGLATPRKDLYDENVI